MGAALLDHKYSEAGVRVALAPSRAGAGAIASAALATLVLIAFTPGPLGWRILAGTWIACAALHALHAAALHRGARGARVVHLSADGEMEVRDGAGEWRAGALRAGSFVAPWLTIVRWRAHGERFDRTVLVLPGMLPPEDFRRMRVLLRWC